MKLTAALLTNQTNVDTDAQTICFCQRHGSFLQFDQVKQFQGGHVSYFEQGLIIGTTIGLVTIVGLKFLSYQGFCAYALR